MNSVTNRIKMFFVAMFSTFAIIAALFMMPSSLSSVGGQTSFSVEYDTDRGGSDYKNFDLSQANHEVCRNYCAADSACRAYTYTKPYQGAAAHCWLKSAVPNPVPYRDCCISGVKGGASGGGESIWGPINNQAGLNGKTLRYYAGTMVERCQADCAGNPQCRGFTLIRAGAYGPNDPPMCYLMSEVTSFAPSNCCISAVKNGVNTGGVSGGNATDITWLSYPSDPNIGLSGKSGRSGTYRCPRFPGGGFERIIGTGVYTEDSRICVAAVHAGLITTDGGVVSIETLAPLRAYDGSTRNGVTSQAYSDPYHPYLGSYRFTR